MPTASPHFSIIVATWNAARTLDRCLSSVQCQTYGSWELILIDGSSTDATLKIAHEHSATVTHCISEPDSGIYDAWNKGIARARGRYVCFLGADDAFADSEVLATVASITKKHQYDLITSRCRKIDASGKELGYAGQAWNYKRIGRRMPVCHVGLWHRSGLFEEYGKFDHSYRITGDLDFLLRLPETTLSLHLDRVTVDVEDAGISRTQVMRRLHEQRRALSSSARHGKLKAWLTWLDKMWRYPIAKVFNLSF